MDSTVIRPMVRGIYDLQMLRTQTGLRLAANFRARLKRHEDDEELGVDEEGELGPKAKSIIEELKAAYKTLTSGIARNRHLPEKEGFVGTELIATFPELVLVHQFVALEREEKRQFRDLEQMLPEVPIYREWLADQVGVGPAMAGVIISTLDPHKAKYISSFWKYAGLDVVTTTCQNCNGAGCLCCENTGLRSRGRSRREEHLVDREYTNKRGKTAIRKSVSYEPWLKTKLFVLATSFMRSKSPWVEVYNARKHRVMTDPNRIKIALADWKKAFDAGEPINHTWPPGRVDLDAKRYMIKQFLAALWVKWRELEGLPVTLSYNEARRGYGHGEAAE